MCSFALAGLLVVVVGRWSRRLLGVEGLERIELVLLLLLLLCMLLMVMGGCPVGVRVGSGLWMLLPRGGRSLVVVVLQLRLLLLGLVALLWHLAGVMLVLRSWARRLCGLVGWRELWLLLLLLRVLVEVGRVRLLVTRLRWRVRAVRLLRGCLLPPGWS